MFYFILCISAVPLLVFISYVFLLLLSRSTGWIATAAQVAVNSSISQSFPIPVNYSIMIVTRNIDVGLLNKLESISRMELREQIVDVLIGLDGVSVSDLQDSLRLQLNKIESQLSIKYIETPVHVGKNAVINKMLPLANGSVLLFTDEDANISKDSLVVLGRWFDNPEVGAVVGLRVIVDKSKFGTAQGSYVGIDTQIKNMEMCFLGSVTSCDGKLYAIRSNLTNSIPLHVTDDTFIGLGAPLHYKRIVFDASLTAEIGRPAKSPAHEFDRRRRVTTRGLHSLIERRELFNFTRYGWYSYCLFANKFCRRFAPLSLVLVTLISTFALSFLIGLVSLSMFLLLILASFSYLNQQAQGKLRLGTPTSDTIATQHKHSPASSSIAIQALKTLSLPVNLLGSGAYFILGMSAMTLGTFDFLCGNKIHKWEPKKSL